MVSEFTQLVREDVLAQDFSLVFPAPGDTLFADSMKTRGERLKIREGSSTLPRVLCTTGLGLTRIVSTCRKSGVESTPETTVILKASVAAEAILDALLKSEPANPIDLESRP